MKQNKLPLIILKKGVTIFVFKTLKYFSLSLWLFLIVGTLQTFAQQKKTKGYSIICPLESIWGKDDWVYTFARNGLRNAKASVTTSDINQVTIFITWTKTVDDGDCMYFHSNYKPIGNPNPIKAATNEHYNLQMIVSNMIKANPFIFRKAFRENIKFVVDYRLFHHTKFRNLDFGNAEKIVIMDAKGIIHADGYKVLLTQKELKKLNHYKGVSDGISGNETENALTAFKAKYGIEKGDRIFLYNDNSRMRIEFSNADDFLKRFETSVDNCKQPLSICLNNDLVATFSIECFDQSIEFSTEGEIIITATNNGETYSVNLNQKDFISVDSCSSSVLNNSYENPVKFLQCYQSAYNQYKDDCENSVRLCLGKETGISFETTCYGNRASISTSGHLSISSKNGQGRTLQF